MEISIEQKKHFLTWVMQNVRFKEREAYWLLNYLITHENILAKIKIVEHVAETPRGIVFSDASQSEPAFIMYKHKLTFDYGEQIFHEIRSNPMFDLYLEFNLEDAWKNQELLSVLEDNPFASWNDKAESKEIKEVLSELEVSFNEQLLREAIDQAIEQGDIERFEALTDQLNKQEKAKMN